MVFNWSIFRLMFLTHVFLCAGVICTCTLKYAALSVNPEFNFTPGLSCLTRKLTVNVAGTLDVTVLLYSGEPDPEWQITPSNPNYQKIQRLLESARKNGFSYGEEKIPMELGFKGFLVRTVPAASSKPELIFGHDTVELQKLFLQTMPKNEESKGIRSHVLKVIKQAGLASTTTKKMYNLKTTVNLEWNDQSWNGPGVVDKNNCYNYATNVKSTEGYVARPGRGGGKPLKKKPFTADDVLSAAEADGLIRVAKEEEPKLGGPFVVPPSHNVVGTPRHFVALFVKYNQANPSDTYGMH